MLKAGSPISHWPFAFRVACNLANVTGSWSVTVKTPSKLWTGKPPDCSNLRVYGCPVVVHTETHVKTLKPKVVEGIHLGCSPNSPGWLVLVNNRLHISRNVVFDELFRNGAPIKTDKFGRSDIYPVSTVLGISLLLHYHQVIENVCLVWILPLTLIYHCLSLHQLRIDSSGTSIDSPDSENQHDQTDEQTTAPTVLDHLFITQGPSDSTFAADGYSVTDGYVANGPDNELDFFLSLSENHSALRDVVGDDPVPCDDVLTDTTEEDGGMTPPVEPDFDLGEPQTQTLLGKLSPKCRPPTNNIGPKHTFVPPISSRQVPKGQRVTPLSKPRNSNKPKSTSTNESPVAHVVPDNTPTSPAPNSNPLVFLLEIHLLFATNPWSNLPLPHWFRRMKGHLTLLHSVMRWTHLTLINGGTQQWLNSPAWGQWHLGTWKPSGVNLIRSKWVFRVKYLSDGTLDKFKVRLVAKGFAQKEGIDYNELFSPCCIEGFQWLLLASTSVTGCDVESSDVAQAFIQATWTETHMAPPPGMRVEPRPDEQLRTVMDRDSPTSDFPRKYCLRLRRSFTDWNKPQETFITSFLTDCSISSDSNNLLLTRVCLFSVTRKIRC